jgi:DNA-binding transcriptional LysR family regulator
MINETNIKYFLRLAETLSFTEVGKQMYISQQAVSKHLAALEDDLGVQLLIRSRNRVELTQAGQRYYQFFHTASQQFQELGREIREQEAGQVRTIRVGYQNWIDFGPAPGTAMAALRKDLPDLFLLGERHDPHKLRELLDSGELDMILIHKRFLPKLDGAHKVPLITAPMQVVVSKYNPLNGPEADFRAFRREPLLLDSFEGESDAAFRSRAQKESGRYGFEPREVVQVPNRDSVYTSAELDRGVFFGSCMTVLSQAAPLLRYDTDVMETLYAVWRDKEGGRCLERYARQLQREYQRLEPDYLVRREWQPER